MAFCWLAQLGCTALQSWPATDVCALDKWWTEAPDRVAARSAVLARAAAGRSVRTAPLNAARMAQRAVPSSKRMPPGQKPRRGGIFGFDSPPDTELWFLAARYLQRCHPAGAEFWGSGGHRPPLQGE